MLNASLIQQITDYKNSLLSHFFIFCSHFYLLKSRINHRILYIENDNSSSKQ